MGLAEQKRELLRIVQEADQETTTKLIDFVQNLDVYKNDSFTAEEIAEFERRSQDFQKSPETGIPWEESMARLRKRITE